MTIPDPKGQKYGVIIRDKVLESFPTIQFFIDIREPYGSLISMILSDFIQVSSGQQLYSNV